MGLSGHIRIYGVGKSVKKPISGEAVLGFEPRTYRMQSKHGRRLATLLGDLNIVTNNNRTALKICIIRILLIIIVNNV
jgi:hypothetical protein